ncbi:MAG: sulfotransferase [Gammaproteobacteria bacterium]
MTTRLDCEEIIRAAGFQTGYFGLLDAGFRERLARFTGWMNEHGNLSPEQILVARRQIIQVVVTRVLLEADRRRIPAIAQERIDRPIFIIGYSRTGTTLLHSLLAQDPANRVPVFWETHQPSPPPGEMPVARGRLEAARREFDSWCDYTPGMFAMHPYFDEGIHVPIEDEEIHSIDLQNTYPTLLFRIPTLPIASLGDTADPSGCYAFQKLFMQQLQWNLPARRWVVKGCAHQFQLKELFAEFPDATCVWPHRDPVEVHRSTLAISAVLYNALTNGSVDWKQFAAGYLQATRAGIDRVLADPMVDDPRIVHLKFPDLARDPLAVLRRIYAACDQPLTPQFEAAARAWLDDPAHRADRYGRYPYSLEPFGLQAGEVAELFADYARRFGLA